MCGVENTGMMMDDAINLWNVERLSEKDIDLPGSGNI
jgi:hypothetical protein